MGPVPLHDYDCHCSNCLHRGSLLHERAAHVIAFDEKARNERNPCQDSYNDPNLHQCVNETLSYLILCLTLRHVFDDLH